MLLIAGSVTSVVSCYIIAQLSIGGAISYRRGTFLADQLRLFYDGPGLVNDWNSQRPLLLVTPSGEARQSWFEQAHCSSSLSLLAFFFDW